MKQILPRFQRFRAFAPVMSVTLILLVITVPATADTVGAGISAGAAKVCPSAGCTCMPESQAETLGYVRSAGETPCFQDSFGRPLYCYSPPAPACNSSGCNTSSSESRAGSTGAGSVKLVITMPTPVAGDISCNGTDSDACAVPGATTTTPASAATDPITGILNFFMSLFGMK